MGLSVLSLAPARKAGVLAMELPFLNGIPIKAIVIFSRQLSVLMGAKVPLVKSLRAVSLQTQHERLKAIVDDVGDEVEAGTALSVAMSKHPKAFSDFFVNMVRSGETTGRLEDVMGYLADQMERDYDLTTKIKGAMIYPIFIVFGLVIVGFIMMVFVVPKLTDVLAESGAELPWPTKVLIAVSGFFRNYSIQLVVGIALAGGFFGWYTRDGAGKRLWDEWRLKIPVFGPLFRNVHIVRFTRSFGTMLSGGIDIPGALDVTADVVGNAYYQEQIRETRREVMDGNPLTTVFERDGSMPPMISQMMSIGEETGRLKEVLEKLTDFYSRELSNSVANLVSAIEPLIMLVMGGAVGVMVAAIILPMYNLATQF
jgi:type IV pilus assembly protein PilC